MNAPLRRVGVVVLVLFALLFVNLNWVQGYKANDYRTSRYNGRVQLTDYERQRGDDLRRERRRARDQRRDQRPAQVPADVSGRSGLRADPRLQAR